MAKTRKKYVCELGSDRSNRRVFRASGPEAAANKFAQELSKGSGKAPDEGYVIVVGTASDGILVSVEVV